jgi:hypothetical protein
MRKGLVIAVLLATASCGQVPRDGESRSESSNLTTFDVAEAPPPPASAESANGRSAVAPPAIAPTAAPGVAFNYRYAFRLAGERIAAVQEQHAAACEKMGIARCRITGMSYRLVGNRDIEGMLAFKLDPAAAREFGRRGIEAVNRAEGMLVDAEITGEDAGARIAAATRAEGQLDEELKRIEAQLARPGLRAAERAELQIQAQQLREQVRGTRGEKTEQQESLARTPMVFKYGTGDLVPGFDGRPRLKQAMQQAVDNLLGGALWIAVALITLLPWLLLIGLGVWAFRRWWPRNGRVPTPIGPPATITPPEV